MAKTDLLTINFLSSKILGFYFDFIFMVTSNKLTIQICDSQHEEYYLTGAKVNQHPPAHHPLDACYYSVMDEPQMS
jgi:hypothetical protein